MSVSDDTTTLVQCSFFGDRLHNATMILECDRCKGDPDLRKIGREARERERQWLRDREPDEVEESSGEAWIV